MPEDFTTEDKIYYFDDPRHMLKKGTAFRMFLSELSHTYIKDLYESYDVPDYISKEQLIDMMILIDSKKINPLHKGCDLTLEGLVGIGLENSLRSHFGRDSVEASIYNNIYLEMKELYDTYILNP